MSSVHKQYNQHHCQFNTTWNDSVAQHHFIFKDLGCQWTQHTHTIAAFISFFSFFTLNFSDLIVKVELRDVFIWEKKKVPNSEVSEQWVKAWLQDSETKGFPLQPHPTHPSPICMWTTSLPTFLVIYILYILPCTVVHSDSTAEKWNILKTTGLKRRTYQKIHTHIAQCVFLPSECFHPWEVQMRSGHSDRIKRETTATTELSKKRRGKKKQNPWSLVQHVSIRLGFQSKWGDGWKRGQSSELWVIALCFGLPGGIVAH